MITDNINIIKERIARACEKAGRDPAEVSIVVVSKGRKVAEIRQAIAAGIKDIGENRVQEAREKYDALRTLGCHNISMHLVGHLQSNKVKTAVKIFSLIHSVDSVSLAREIDEEAGKLRKVQDVLLQVKTSPEATKFGLKPEETAQAFQELNSLKNISIKGFMTMAPVVEDPEQARPYFRALRELRDQINALSTKQDALRTLSMGMTDDFEAALAEGATMLRLGRAIFAD